MCNSLPRWEETSTRATVLIDHTRSTAAEKIKELLVVCLTLKGLKNVGQI